jgi:hypothetical protein
LTGASGRAKIDKNQFLEVISMSEKIHFEPTWELPNPFYKADGSIMSTKAEWEEKRKAYLELLSEMYYGEMPGRPQTLTASELSNETICQNTVCHKVVRLCAQGEEAPVFFNVHVYRPVMPCEEKLIPVVIPAADTLPGEIISMAAEQGFEICSFEIAEAAPDDKEKIWEGGCAKAYPGYTWRALAMWAWLQSRVIDWLETQKDTDVTKTVVTGHSRMGKAALCCGIYDERAAVVAPAGSGCGGMASMRLSGCRLGENIGLSERIGVMLNKERFPYWLMENVADYGTPDGKTRFRENEIPFDANILGACVAPRRLILVEGLDDDWINPFGTQVSWLAASEVFEFLGVKEHSAIHYREGGHAYTKQDWSVVLDFTKVQLCGKEKTTGYKSMRENENKAGYSWRCPKTND